MSGNPYVFSQQKYMQDPRYGLAQNLIQQGSSTAPVVGGGWGGALQGLARALTGVAGGYMQKEVKNDYDAKQAKLQAALAEAVQSNDPAKIQQVLMSNPDTMDKGIDLSIADSQYNRNRKDKLTDTATEHDWQMQLENQRAQRAAQLQAAGFSHADAMQRAQQEFEIKLRNNPGVPQGFKQNPDGTMAPVPGGPADPGYKQSVTTPPTGYRTKPDGTGVEPIPGGPADPTVVNALATAQGRGNGTEMKNANTLRDDYNKATLSFKTAQDGYQKVVAAANTPPSGAGDVALVFGFMKTIDPTSVVREGEFATAQNTTGVPGQVSVLYNNLLNGQRLTPEQRKEFVNQATAAFKTYENNYNNITKQYRGIAERNNINPQDVIVDYNTSNQGLQAGQAGIVPPPAGQQPAPPGAAPPAASAPNPGLPPPQPTAPPTAPALPTGAPPATGAPTAPPNGNAPVKITSPAEYNSLPSGTLYVNPSNGNIQRKP